MDRKDEFEFRPLTEGLGFHKKTVNLQEDRKKADKTLFKNKKVLSDSADLEKLPRNEAMDEVKNLVDNFPSIESDFLDTPKKPEVKINTGLPRNDLQPNYEMNSEEVLAKKDDLKIDPTVFDRKIDLVPEMKPLIEKTEEKVEIEKKLVERLVPSTTSFSAMFIDLLTIVGLTNIFLAALLFITEVDVVNVMIHPAVSMQTLVSFALLYVFVNLFYLLISRVFFLRTLGEWAMDQQCGTQEQSIMWSYPAKITFRFLLTLVSGVILLPLISKIAKKDLVGKATGLELQKKEMRWE